MNIPVGVSDFTEIRQNGYYYVDKTGLICEPLRTTATKVTLITRPRRFRQDARHEYAGGVLSIFSRDSEPGSFAGLEVSGQEEALCAAVDEPVAGDLYFL